MSRLQDICGEIDLKAELSSHLNQLYMNSEYSDVTFIVDGVKFPANKNILAVRSHYFRALLYGGLAETTQNDIKLNVPLEAFKTTLKYMYTGCMSLDKMKDEQILDVLGLVEQYGLETLKSAISLYLTNNLSLKNCCKILDAARLYNLELLSDTSMTFMDRNATELLTSESFKTLSQDLLCTLLDRDSFFALEIDILNGVNEWYKSNLNADIETVVSKIRLPSMNFDQLSKIVRPCKILDLNQLLDAIHEKMISKNIRHRGALWSEENVATEKYKSKTIRGEDPLELLNGDVTSYGGSNGFTSHRITDSGDESIVVELGTTSIINHIKLLLWDQDKRSYQYYIEISVDQNNWNRVIDCTEYHCRSWQFHYFTSQAVRYIKLVGTLNTEFNVFHVVALEAYHTAKVPALLNGFISPKHNVATADNGAKVIEGQKPDALLNGNINNYDGGSGYTYHNIGYGAIIVQLNQPYNIGSLRLLLWDGDARTYSFYIETSVNQQDWEMAVDKRNEQLRSWQTLTFTPRPVAFFKIVGTSNSANSDFHCVHFESPSQGETAGADPQEQA